jgi:WD40 repeat protein
MWSLDGARIGTASEDKTSLVWEVATRKELTRLEGHTGGVNGAAWRPDGACIVTASWDKTVRVWEAATGKKIARIGDHNSC